MSRRANPTTVGAFVLGAMVIALATVIYLGSVRVLSDEETFVLYFNESINGLAEGAPVKFKGVPIGTVSDIRIRYNQPDFSSAIPVFIRIDATRLQRDLGIEFDISSEAQLAEALRDGLRGRLQLDSLITGQLFIELDYFQPAPSDFELEQETLVGPLALSEIPTIPSVFAEFGAEAEDIIAKFSRIDIETINTELITLLRQLNTTLETLDLPELREAFFVTLEDLRYNLDQAEVPILAEQVQQTLEDFRALALDLRRVAPRASDQWDNLVEDARVTLDDVSRAAAALEATTGDDSALNVELQLALTEVQRAARAARELLQAVERNPRLFLTGRRNPDE